MWPYATRGSRYMDPVEFRSPSSLGDKAFHANDAVIKLWLPERLLGGIDALCADHDASRPDILRWILFEHVYGRVEFVHLRRKADTAVQRDAGVFSRRVARPDDAPSARAVTARLLGKSTLDVKLLLPAALCDALRELAREQQQPLSDYLRGVLSRHLLGERFYREWQRALPGVHESARAYEED